MTSCIDHASQDDFSSTPRFSLTFSVPEIHRKCVHSFLALNPSFCASSFASFNTLHFSTLGGNYCRDMIRNCHHYTSWRRHLQWWPSHHLRLSYLLAYRHVRFITSQAMLNSNKHIVVAFVQFQALIVSHEKPFSMVVLRRSVFLILVWMCLSFWFPRLLTLLVLGGSAMRASRWPPRLGRRTRCRRLHLLHCHLLLVVLYMVCPPCHVVQADLCCSSSLVIQSLLHSMVLPHKKKRLVWLHSTLPWQRERTSVDIPHANTNSLLKRASTFSHPSCSCWLYWQVSQSCARWRSSTWCVWCWHKWDMRWWRPMLSQGWSWSS